MPGKGCDFAMLVQVDFDNVATRNREALLAGLERNKVPSEYALINARPGFPLGETSRLKLQSGLRKLTAKSVLMILGHGDWKSQHVGLIDGPETATLLKNNGLNIASVIKIVACSAGRDVGSAKDVRLGVSHDSFASKFHQKLMDHEVFIDVVAPTRAVAALQGGLYSGRLFTKDSKLERGDPDTPSATYRRTGSFVKYTAVNKVQKREIVTWSKHNDIPAWVYD